MAWVHAARAHRCLRAHTAIEDTSLLSFVRQASRISAGSIELQIHRTYLATIQATEFQQPWRYPVPICVSPLAQIF